MPALLRICAMLLAVFALTAGTAQAKRVALVIANGRYANANALPNPPADARLIAASLKRAGFTSVDVQIDLGKTALEVALRNFGQSAEGADVALVYYAGHGIEAGGQNYLIPTDAKLERDRDLEIEATRLDTVLLMGEGAKLRLVVLDACRNNPFATKMQRTMRNRAVGRGLAAVEPEGETLVVYAAKAGATAADGEGANSPFAEALAKRIVQPGLEISLLFRAVRDDVLAKTGRTQEPFTYGSLSGTAFYFVGGQAPAPVAQTVAVQPPPVSAGPSFSKEASEALFWQGALSANTAPAYREYLRRYPAGEFAELARQNVVGLSRPKTATVAPTPTPAPSTPPASGGSFGSGFSVPKLSDAFGAAPSTSGTDPATRFAFAVSPTTRRSTTNQFITQLQSSNKELGDLFAATFALQDIFGALDKAMVPYGLKTNNLADGLTIFFDTMRDIANGVESTPTRTQALAVRRQMALVLQSSSDTNALNATQRQEMSDGLVLYAMFMSLAQEAAKKGDPKEARNFSNGVAELAKTQFGVDLRAIRLTDNGYQM
jgi:uncharacterized caspase-like protein